MRDAIHEFNITELKLLAPLASDAISFMDDWGAQGSLLISPETWRKYFKPMYKEYCDIIRGGGKRVFFHSDGFTLDIIPHLIELGFDAVNLQIFCIGIEKIAGFKGKITFWGEIDRQHLLPKGTAEEIDAAVRKVRSAVWAQGGAIAQCEFGAGANPANVRQVFKSWAEAE
jgi:hypothetical protein